MTTDKTEKSGVATDSAPTSGSARLRRKLARFRKRLEKRPLTMREIGKQETLINRIAFIELKNVGHRWGCSFAEDVRCGFDHPRNCDCGYGEWLSELLSNETK